MYFGLISDLLFAGLLVATLIYMARLNRRLDGLRAGREEFEALLKRFGAATEQAQANVAAMKVAADGAGRGLQEEIDRARALREDLAFLADRANTLADQLEAAIGRARAPAAKVTRMPVREEPRAAVVPTDSSPAAKTAAKPAAAPALDRSAPLSSSESELLRRLSTLR